MPMIVMIIGTFVHIILCYVFVHVLDYDVVGLAYASTLKDFVLMISVFIYGRCSSQINIALAPINKDAFKGWCEYLKISLPTTVMICAEYWAFEILTIFAGIIGVTELASMTLCISVYASMW